MPIARGAPLIAISFLPFSTLYPRASAPVFLRTSDFAVSRMSIAICLTAMKTWSLTMKAPKDLRFGLYELGIGLDPHSLERDQDAPRAPRELPVPRWHALDLVDLTTHARGVVGANVRAGRHPGRETGDGNDPTSIVLSAGPRPDDAVFDRGLDRRADRIAVVVVLLAQHRDRLCAPHGESSSVGK